MRKAEKHNLIMKKAEQYACSGQYSGWLAIEHQLRQEGFPEARRLLDDENTRERLDRLCKEAKAA